MSNADAPGPHTAIPDFFWFIEERPDPTLDFFTETCPLCNGNLPYEGHEETTMGFFLPEGLTYREQCLHPWNGNHHTRRCTCAHCGASLVFGMSHGNAWVTERCGAHAEARLVAGVPSCCGEHTRYTCSDCGGTVTVSRHEPRIRIPGEHHYGFACDGCDNASRAWRSHYEPHEPPRPAAKTKGPWMLSLGQAVVIGNSKAIRKGLRLG